MSEITETIHRKMREVVETLSPAVRQLRFKGYVTGMVANEDTGVVTITVTVYTGPVEAAKANA